MTDVTLSVLSNYAELTLACAGKKAFYNYHSALQIADDNLPGRLWNTIFGLNSEPLFSGTYARHLAKRDGDIQCRILHGALASCRKLKWVIVKLIIVPFVIHLINIVTSLLTTMFEFLKQSGLMEYFLI